MSIIHTIDKKRDIDGSWKEKNKKGARNVRLMHTYAHEDNAKTHRRTGERQSWFE